MKETIRILSALRAIAETLNQSMDLKSSLFQSLELILDLLELRSGWIFLFDEHAQAYHLAASHQMPPAFAPEQPCWQGGCQCNLLARQGRLTEASNMVRCSRIDRAVGDRGNLVFHASIPLETPRGHIGILNAATPSGGLFPTQDLELMMAVGNQMAIAIERAMLYEHIHNRRLHEHESFLNISNIMLSGGSFAAVLGEIARMTCKVFEGHSCLLAINQCSQEGPLQAAQIAQFGFPENVSTDELLCFLNGSCSFDLQNMAKRGPLLLRQAEARNDQGELPMSVQALSGHNESSGEFFCLNQGSTLANLFGSNALYAAPIRGLSECGLSLGMLYVGHSNQAGTAEDAHLLSLFANQAALAVEQARQEAIRLSHSALELELSLAAEIQQGFLPESVPSLPAFSIAVRYEAAQQVSGDFYDFIDLANGCLGLVVADVAGKGMSAALVMALTRTLLRAMVDEASTPLDAVLKTNRILVRDNRSNKFVSLVYMVLDPAKNSLTYIRAGHNLPYHYRAAQEKLVYLGGEGMVLGVVSDPPMSQQSCFMADGDVVVLFTDGITEAMNDAMQFFGDERLEELIMAEHGRDVECIADAICQEVKQHRGSTAPSDDFTLIVLKKQVQMPAL